MTSVRERRINYLDPRTNGAKLCVKLTLWHNKLDLFTFGCFNPSQIFEDKARTTLIHVVTALLLVGYFRLSQKRLFIDKRSSLFQKNREKRR